MNTSELNSDPLGFGDSLPWVLGYGGITGSLSGANAGKVWVFGRGTVSAGLTGVNAAQRITHGVLAAAASLSGSLEVTRWRLSYYVLAGAAALSSALRGLIRKPQVLSATMSLQTSMTNKIWVAIHASWALTMSLSGVVATRIRVAQHVAGTLATSMIGALTEKVWHRVGFSGVMTMGLSGTWDPYDGPRGEAPAERTTGAIDLTTRTTTSVGLGG